MIYSTAVPARHVLVSSRIQFQQFNVSRLILLWKDCHSLQTQVSVLRWSLTSPRRSSNPRCGSPAKRSDSAVRVPETDRRVLSWTGGWLHPKGPLSEVQIWWISGGLEKVGKKQVMCWNAMYSVEIHLASFCFKNSRFCWFILCYVDLWFTVMPFESAIFFRLCVCPLTRAVRWTAVVAKFWEGGNGVRSPRFVMTFLRSFKTHSEVYQESFENHFIKMCLALSKQHKSTAEE